MNTEDLYHAARHIVRRNLSSKLVAAVVDWEETSSHLNLIYFFEPEPEEDDAELLELALCELLAEFSDIKSAESSTKKYNESFFTLSSKVGVVYERDA